jgi:hypothetical protein
MEKKAKGNPTEKRVKEDEKLPIKFEKYEPAAIKLEKKGVDLIKIPVDDITVEVEKRAARSHTNFLTVISLSI